MRPAYFDSPEYKKRQAEITHLNWKKGVYKFLLKKESRNCLNYYCKNHFVVPQSDKQKYCSQNCWYLVRRSYQIKRSLPCLTCGKLVTQKGASRFCSLKCQSTNNYNEYIRRWKQGLETGTIGITTKTLSAHLRRYLHEKYGEKCSLCKWDKKHIKTQVVPLEINHIDGNADNNKEDNLELLCPNCHALTPSFRNLNKGKGRSWRLAYLKSHS